MKTRQMPVKAPGPREQFIKLVKRMDSVKQPTLEDIDHLRELVVSTPALWCVAAKTTSAVHEQLIEKLSGGRTRSFLLAEVDILKKQLGYDAAPILERLLIENILTVRLRLIYVENHYTHGVMNQAIAYKTGEYWDNLLSSAQARFLRAIETLARVRRLARNTPALQINIAREGGQQLNVQNDASGAQATRTEARALEAAPVEASIRHANLAGRQGRCNMNGSRVGGRGRLTRPEVSRDS
jgi:hypothetical protein